MCSLELYSHLLSLIVVSPLAFEIRTIYNTSEESG